MPITLSIGLEQIELVGDKLGEKQRDVPDAATKGKSTTFNLQELNYAKALSISSSSSRKVLAEPRYVLYYDLNIIEFAYLITDILYGKVRSRRKEISSILSELRVAICEELKKSVSNSDAVSYYLFNAEEDFILLVIYATKDLTLILLVRKLYTQELILVITIVANYPVRQLKYRIIKVDSYRRNYSRTDFNVVYGLLPLLKHAPYIRHNIAKDALRIVVALTFVDDLL